MRPAPWRRVRRGLGRAAAVVTGVAVLVVAAPGTASAHPLGNFTVNRYSGVVVSGGAVTVDHVIDLAEIPTAQRVPAIDTSGDGRLARGELATWSRSTCVDAAAALILTVGGSTPALAVTSAGARALAGQAGLPVLRVECALRAAVPVAGPTRVRFVDDSAAGEVGWREVTAAGDRTTLTSSDVPARSVSDRLTSYPADLLASPLAVSSATLTVRPGGPALAGPDPVAGDALLGDTVLARGADRLTTAYEGLLARYDGGPLVALVALLGAVLLGAAHALAPGHGKTVMAFYLSGQRRGALRSAATVGATVTATHTAGVLLLGLLVSAGTTFVPARVYPWLSVASGLLVVGVGLALLRSARRGAGHGHGTGPGQHTHDHPHPHPHPHSHSHDHHHHRAHEAGTGPSRGGLIAMGMAGGLLPSPSALLVFLGALALGHPWFGVSLVVAFGAGMAATLAAVGVLVMRLRRRAESRLVRRPRSRLAPVLRVAPSATAVVVIVLGAALAGRGFAGIDVSGTGIG